MTFNKEKGRKTTGRSNVLSSNEDSNNRLAAEAARDEAARKGFQSVIVSTEVAGDANEISEIYARLACNLAATICDPANKDDLKVFLQEVAKHLRAGRTFIREVLDVDFARPICLIFAGEPTVVVTGSGKGGRNQHLALAFSIRLKEFRITSADVSFLSAGTDGIDGPTDAAGALAVCGDLEEGTTEEVLAEEYFKNNDSYGFYEKYDNGSHLIKTGHTGTNVMDIHLLTIAPRMQQLRQTIGKGARWLCSCILDRA
ncbi:hypothetical protein NQ318_019302 [Aromia moschata]|uniref:MOFRL domain-containing protein n=1 Tax=Aromia moschata TaxID=1265417 RepID=A0AAV8X351_9CUCU|nr:hypothetical protein NQ318_019302 [Aromia moschata]